MRTDAIAELRAPDDRGPLALTIYSEDEAGVVEGILRASDGAWFPVLKSVPVFLMGDMRPDLTDFCRRHGLPLPEGGTTPHATGQEITNVTFSDKWRRFKDYGLQPSHEDFLFGWYCKKLGLPDREALKDFYRDFDLTLEVGPGAGFKSRFIAQHTRGRHFALDISEAAFTTFENTRHLPNCTVVQADLMHAPFADDTFDFILADGVLHHTPDTRAAVETLYRKVKPGGRFFFYVYRRMGAARYFVDQHIRDQFMKLPPEECYAACESLTDLGRELSRLNAKITLTKPVNVLGIPAGEHDVQRLIYYNWVKCFWNDAFDYETNNMVNFDWYHPHHAWQHTPEEVANWLSEMGVREFRFNDANPNGISVLLRKPA